MHTSLPTFSIARAIISPVAKSLFAEIVPTCARASASVPLARECTARETRVTWVISCVVEIFLESFVSSFTTSSTPSAMPALRVFKQRAVLLECGGGSALGSGDGSGGEPGTTRAQRNAPRRRSIGFMPAATDLHPSLKIARASTWNTQNKTTRHWPDTHVPSLPPAPHRRSRGTITSNIVRLGRHLGCTHTHTNTQVHT